MDTLKELKTIYELQEIKDDIIETEVLSHVEYKGKKFPIISFSIGSKDPAAPTLGLFGGVHGLERIGTHVVLSYLSSIMTQLKWDEELRESFKNYRLVSIPLINPAGMAYFKRANPRGVDLMRNAPTKANIENAMPLLSGQSYSKKIPWFRGDPNEMEIESRSVVEFVEKKLFQSQMSLSVDFHSGFGLKDRLWYPYGYTKSASIRQPEIDKLTNLFNETIPHHVYKIEPQCASYAIQGDLWDYLLDEHISRGQGIYLPWTLEMGSWSWVKKNPLQIFSAEGLFNPIKDHRYQRTMRRHFLLIDFLSKAVRNHKNWIGHESATI